MGAGSAPNITTSRRIPSLAAIDLLLHWEPRIEVWEHTPADTWSLCEFRSGQTADIPSPPVWLVVDETYLASREPID